MIVIDYDEKPKNTIYYLSALLYRFIKRTCRDFEEARKYFKNNILDSDMNNFFSDMFLDCINLDDIFVT